MNVNDLIKVLSIQTHTFDSWRMFSFIIRQCKAMGLMYYTNNGNIYVTKGSADSYPCIVAHIDTVHEITDNLTVMNINGNLTGFNVNKMEQTGIGGDDKVGIFIALECLKTFDNIKAAFFCDEEAGCIGSYEADIDFFEDCNFVLQCDRKGKSDFITNASLVELSGKDFQDDVKRIMKKYGYSFKHGLMTDVMALKELGINVSMANISCGYYNPHEANEYVNIIDVSRCLSLVSDIIERLGENKYDHAYTHVYKYEYPINDFSYYGKKQSDKFQQLCSDCWQLPASTDYGLCETCYQYYKKQEILF